LLIKLSLTCIDQSRELGNGDRVIIAMVLVLRIQSFNQYLLRIDRVKDVMILWMTYEF